MKALVNDQALLQQCVHESLRLHPSSPESWRRALAPHRLSDGTEIEAGDHVIIELETANRDADVFGSDADVFNPLRARPPGRNPSGLSFGLGMHVCIGLNLVAGTIVRDGQALDETTHQYGSMTVILRELIAAGLALTQTGQASKMPNQNVTRGWPIRSLALHESQGASSKAAR